MAAITLAGARTLTSAFLDDPNNARWSTTVVDVALQQALSACISEYAGNGGDNFDDEFAVTTTSAGLGTTVALAQLRAVQVLSGTTYYPIPAQNRSQRVVNDTVARTLVVVGIREYVVPTSANPTDPLIGVSTVAAAGTWAGFERWVCLEAALALAVQDNDTRAGIIANAERSKGMVMGRGNTYGSRPLPEPESQTRALAYIYTPGLIQLIRDQGLWW